MNRSFAVVLCLTGTLLCAIPAGAQGVQTAVLTGATTSADGAALPGVTVTASSPALLGDRTEVTDVNGVYAINGLPTGTYSVTFDLDNFQPARREHVILTVGGTIEVNANMSLAARTETITVTAEAPSTLTTVATGQSLTKGEIDALPIGRRPVDIAELSPGLTTNTFVAGQLAISGAYGFDNVFMVDGVDVNDTINGTANNLYIEDAIQNTTVLTNGISAEYGRFSGGVVNMVTRSGGNMFSGSFRENLSNPSWISETPLERSNGVEHTSLLGKTHEATFGGPVAKDRLWFFGAGRWETTNTPNTFSQTGVAYTRTDRNRRGELKLTGHFRAADVISGTYINNSTEQANASGIGAAAILDQNVLVTRTLPNRLLAVNYSGVVRSSLFATLQYSQKRQQFRNNGGTSTALMNSPFETLGATAPGGLFYHAPYLDATDPEQRNNQQLTGSVSHLLSSKRAGTHDLKGGAEYFVSTGIGGNSQSSPAMSSPITSLMRSAGVARGKRLADAALHSGPLTGLELPGDTRREDRHQDLVAVRAGSLDRESPSDARPRHALRTGPLARDRRHHRRRYELHRSASGRNLRARRQRQDDGPGQLWTLFGQVRPGAVLVEQQREPSERGRLRL